MVSWSKCLCLTVLGLFLLLPAPVRATQADTVHLDSLGLFFRSLAGIPKEFHFAPPLTASSKYIWEKFKTEEKFHEELDGANNKTTRGYLTITFLLPMGLAVASYDNPKKIRHPADPVAILDYRYLRKNGTLQYKTGCLGSTLEAYDGLRRVVMKLQIYKDTRLSRWSNLYRYGLPTASAHLKDGNLQTYLPTAFLGLIEEWLRWSVKDKLMAENEFTRTICKDIALYLRSQQSGFHLRWKAPYKRLLELNKAFELTIGDDFHDEQVLPQLSELLGHISTYAEAIERHNLGQEIDQLNDVLGQVAALVEPEQSARSLGFLFVENAEKKRVFCYGNKCLPLYFARLARLSPANRIHEMGLLLRHYFAVIPTLLRIRSADFLTVVRATNLEEITRNKLEEVQEQLIRTRQSIHAFAPGPHPFKVEKKNSKDVREIKVFPQKQEVKQPLSDFERFAGLLKKPPMHEILWNLKLPGYPVREIVESDYYLHFPSDDVSFSVFMEEYQTLLPEIYKISVGSAYKVDALPIAPLQARNIRVKSAEYLSRWDKDRLGEMWASVHVKYLSRLCQIDETNASAHQFSFLDQLHSGLTARISEALIALVGKVPDKGFRFAGKRHSVVEYINLLESLPGQVLFFLNHTADNVRLFKMTRDLTSDISFETYQPGALDFIAYNHPRLNSQLMGMFAECYLIRYLNSTLTHPFGALDAERHAVLLSHMLVPKDDAFTTADLTKKRAFLDGIISTLEKTFATLCEYSFKK